MSFNNALSGINAAQKDLNVTANNIANVNTTGFKESRAEFADVYANSIFVNAKTQVGNGVATGAVAQQFHQGALQFVLFEQRLRHASFYLKAVDYHAHRRRDEQQPYNAVYPRHGHVRKQKLRRL